MAVHGGRLAARTLKQAGVEVIFTLSGGHIMPLYDGCLDEGIQLIDVRHEQAAVHAADAWARCRPGSIGVAAITAGPGLTDGVTGIANAWRANSPVFILCGQGPFKELGRGALQELNHIDIVRPITKYAGAVFETQRIPEHIELAVRHAVSGIPGPAYLEIPMDTFMAECEWEQAPMPPVRTAVPRSWPDQEDVRTALELLRGARRPVLVAGTSVKWSRAAAPLNRFVRQTHIPAYTNGMGRGTIPPDCPEFLQHSRRAAFKQADCVILAGAELDFRMRFGRTIAPEATIIQLEMEASRIGQNRPSDAALVGNIGCGFELLVAELGDSEMGLDFSAWRDQLRTFEAEAEEEMEGRMASDEVPIDPMRLCREVRDWVETLGDSVVIGDGGDIVSTAASILPVKREGAWMDPGPLGTLGVGMPFALAAQLANPDQRVVIIYGDGSFGLNGFEYDTAVRFGLPVIGVMGNDGAWGQMMRPQGAVYGWDRLTATLLRYTRYDRVVEALGGHGERVERPEDIRPALERAAASGKPALVNVIIRQDREFKKAAYSWE
jgi:acetolactate synthase-1/2/3 large subunit